MNLEGNNIILRAVELKDADLLLELINDSEIEYMIGGWSFPISSKNQIDWINSLENKTNTLRGIIEVKQTGVAIGTVILTDIDYKNGNAEIHIKLKSSEFGKKGYGTEAINTVVNYAFDELRLHLIHARVNNYNIASKNLFEKCGFVEEGILKDRFYKKGEYVDVVSYSIVKENSDD